MVETLKHYAAEGGMVFDPAYDYSLRRQRYDKPRGFWVSVQGPDDWHEWCTAEEFAMASLANEHDVILAPEANILRITGYRELVNLNRRYPFKPIDPYATLNPWLSERHPDWFAITAEFDGIIIAPYQGAGRFDLFWYYGWDCASGCIWNLDAIESVTPVRAEVTS